MYVSPDYQTWDSGGRGWVHSLKSRNKSESSCVSCAARGRRSQRRPAYWWVSEEVYLPPNKYNNGGQQVHARGATPCRLSSWSARYTRVVSLPWLVFTLRLWVGLVVSTEQRCSSVPTPARERWDGDPWTEQSRRIMASTILQRVLWFVLLLN